MSHTRIRRRNAARAFTLIELLVVIVILAILAAVVITRVTHRVDDAREAKAIADIRSISDALEMYKLDMGTYPSGDQGLQALVTNVDNNPKWNKPYLQNNVPKDAWGNLYVYRFPGEHGEYDVFSVGPDGQAGTGDDITSWQQ